MEVWGTRAWHEILRTAESPGLWAQLITRQWGGRFQSWVGQGLQVHMTRTERGPVVSVEAVGMDFALRAFHAEAPGYFPDLSKGDVSRAVDGEHAICL